MVWAFHRAYGRSNDRMAPLFASRTARTATSCSDFKRTIHHVARSLFINPLTLRLLTSSESTARAVVLRRCNVLLIANPMSSNTQTRLIVKPTGHKRCLRPCS